MERYINGIMWPSRLSTVKENIFHTTQLSKYLKGNCGNHFTNVPLFLEQYKRYYHINVAMRKIEPQCYCGFTEDTPPFKNGVGIPGKAGFEISAFKKGKKDNLKSLQQQ